MKIDDRLYKYQGFGGIATYKCTGEIQRKNCVLFELECLSCTHGSRCVVLVKKEGDGTYRFSAMVNNDEHELWHTTCSKPDRYYETAAEAKKAVYLDNIEKCDIELRNLSERIKREESRKKELQDHLKNIVEATK
jgi:hypothetical protein